MKRTGLQVIRHVNGSFAVALFVEAPQPGSESTMFGEHFVAVASLLYRGSCPKGAVAAARECGLDVSP